MAVVGWNTGMEMSSICRVCFLIQAVLRGGLFLLALLGAHGASADGAWPPLDAAGRKAYDEYLKSPDHRAFAIAPGGAWAWQGGLPTRTDAEEQALETCQGYGSRGCMLYGVDQQVVWNQEAWRAAWRPYPTADQAARARMGTRVGQRFPNLRLSREGKQPLTLADLRGRVVILHFWGSWCPHCILELPEIQALHGRYRSDRRLAFVLVPVRETLQEASRWMRKQGLSLPLYDGGASVTVEKGFRLADGTLLMDRELARVFPSTYVLDARGVVLFRQTGPLPVWDAYAPLLEDAARHAGR